MKRGKASEPIKGEVLRVNIMIVKSDVWLFTFPLSPPKPKPTNSTEVVFESNRVCPSSLGRGRDIH